MFVYRQTERLTDRREDNSYIPQNIVGKGGDKNIPVENPQPLQVTDKPYGMLN